MCTHFLVSESPQKFDHSIQALCGATLKNPEPTVTLEIPELGLAAFGLRDCMECAQKANEFLYKRPEKSYLYGLIEGEEAMHSGDTFEKLENAVSKHSKFTQGIDSAPEGKSETAATENRENER